MISTLSIFQFASMMGYLVLAMLMLVCPYEGRQFRNYYRIQRLFLVSLLVMAGQFAAQLLFGFRAQNPHLGTLFNMVCIPIASQFYTMSVFRMLRVERSCRREWIITSAYTGLNAIVLIGAMPFADVNTLKWIVRGSIVAYMLVNIFFFIVLTVEYRRFCHNLEENFATPMEEQAKWILTYLCMRMALCILIPVVSFGTNFAMIYSLCAYFIFAYFAAKLVYFGYYIQGFENVEREVQAEEKEIRNAPEGPSDEELGKVGKLLSKWIEDKAYCQSEVTLSSLAKDLGVQRPLLFFYLSNVEKKTFRDWIIGLRVEEAKAHIIQNPNYGNETIANECGFSSRSHFQNAFRQIEGITPGEWRNRNLK